MYQIHCALGCAIYLSMLQQERVFYVVEFSLFSSPSPHAPLYFLSFIIVKGAFVLGGHKGSWLGCQGLPAVGAVSILELAPI